MSYWRIPTLAVIGWVLLLGACDEPLEPIVGTERPYTIYGFLTPSKDTQSVVVIPIRDRLDPGEPTTIIDAQVRSMDVGTGEVVDWKDSLVVFDNSSQRRRFSHVYWAPFRAVHNHTYRLEVERSDGALSTAETLVPPEPVAEVEAPRFFGQSVASQRVVWSHAKRLLNVTVRYTAHVEAELLKTIEIPYQSEVEEGHPVVEIDLKADFNTITKAFPEGGAVALDTVLMNVFSVNEAWDPPGGVFDLDLLVQPGTFSNVENGFGFVGSAVGAEVGWLPDEASLRRIGFATEHQAE